MRLQSVKNYCFSLLNMQICDAVVVVVCLSSSTTTAATTTRTSQNCIRSVIQRFEHVFFLFVHGTAVLFLFCARREFTCFAYVWTMLALQVTKTMFCFLFSLYLTRSLQLNSRTVSAHLLSQTTWNNQEINTSTFPHSANHILNSRRLRASPPCPLSVLKFHNKVIIQFGMLTVQRAFVWPQSRLSHLTASCKYVNLITHEMVFNFQLCELCGEA